MAHLTKSSGIKVALILVLMVALFGVATLGSFKGSSSKLGSYSEIGNDEIDMTGIDSISLSWAAGQVEMGVHEGDRIILTEEAAGLTKAHSMRWDIIDGTLRVEYGEGFSCVSLSEKKLSVLIPLTLASQLQEVSIEGASGTYVVTDIECNSFKVNLASGHLQAENVSSKRTTLQAASGNLYYQGKISDSLDVDIASGKVETIIHDQIPTNIDLNIVSGSVKLALPENDGFTTKVDSVSGSFNNEFETTSLGDNTSIYKDGDAAALKASMVSGTLTIARR